MKQEVLSLFPWPWLSSLALLIFFSLFVTILLRVNLKSRRIQLNLAANLPLDDGEKNE